MKILMTLCALLSATALPTTVASAGSDRIVVLISVDGLAQYYLDDPKAEMPTIRQLAADGARATMMKASVPTVTWPNHTTLVTGDQPARHGVVGNAYFDRSTGKIVTLITDPTYDKDQIVKAPTIYDLAKANGLKTAAIIWPASRNAKSLDWTVPDVASEELLLKYSTPALLEQCKQAGLSYEKYAEWNKTGRYDLRDRLNLDVFKLIIKMDRPNLALLHLINVDHTEHLKGPQTEEAYAAVKQADGFVHEVIEELQQDFPGKATVFIVSDHGFYPIRQSILPNVILHRAGLLDVKGLKIVGGTVRQVSQGGCAMIYVLDPANRAALMDRVSTLFKDVEGVEKIVNSPDFKEYGLADPKDDPNVPDMVMFAKSGYTFGDTAGGELSVTTKSAELKGTHGHDPNHSALHATFVAWGAGIRPGVKLGTISNIDVAPTIAAVMGLTMKDVDGKVLDAVLSDPH